MREAIHVPLSVRSRRRRRMKGENAIGAEDSGKWTSEAKTKQA